MAGTKYRVMEYLSREGRIVGWAFLKPDQYAKWKKSPDSRSMVVQAFCSVVGMEQSSELGDVPCNRMWDYCHTATAGDYNSLKKLVMGDELEAAFLDAR